MRWTLDMDADLGLYTINDSEGEFARVTAVRDDHNRARLIAAAPELLERGSELQAARRAHKLNPCRENAGRVHAASAAFDAAIAKATGEGAPIHPWMTDVERAKSEAA